VELLSPPATDEGFDPECAEIGDDIAQQEEVVHVRQVVVRSR
jgi:hypothetical protein